MCGFDTKNTDYRITTTGNGVFPIKWGFRTACPAPAGENTTEHCEHCDNDYYSLLPSGRRVKDEGYLYEVNFLAHAYLSFNDRDILVGNMISDFVKGKTQYDYPPAIHKGIVLHRRIDAFTDTHAAVAEAKKVFQPHYRLYSGAMIDIVFDHFLANDKNEFTDESLHAFTLGVYRSLESYTSDLPPRFVAMFPYMKSENWLYRYRIREGIASSLRGLVRRSSFLSDYETAIAVFNKEYETLQECYNAFFPDVKNYTKEQMKSILL